MTLVGDVRGSALGPGRAAPLPATGPQQAGALGGLDVGPRSSRQPAPRPWGVERVLPAEGLRRSEALPERGRPARAAAGSEAPRPSGFALGHRGASTSRT